MELDVPGDNRTAMVFTLLGDAVVSGTEVPMKTAAKLGDGDKVTIEAMDRPIEILFMCADRLDQPIAWRGLIVMTTQGELDQAYDDLEKGVFIKEEAKYEGD